MDSINIFDINNLYLNESQWYKQTATGTIPPSRVDFCAISVSSSDNSSQNIYLYGGRNPIDDIIYDDIYVLSLPSFIWTKIYSGDSPRYGHTCHLVGNRQILTVGGQSSTNMTKNCDWEVKGVGIMDLSTKIWGSVFDVNAKGYTVTQDIIEQIGGTGEGGATITMPVDGFEDAGLLQLFDGAVSTAIPTSSTYDGNSAKKSNIAAIVGGVVGGFLGLALLGALSWFLIHRKRKDHTIQTHTQDDPKYTADTDLRLIPEMDGQAVQPSSELSAVEKRYYSELQGDTQPVELDARQRDGK